VGLRPGEKLHEELFYDREEVEATASAKVLRAISPPSSVDVRAHARQLLAMASGADEGALRRALLDFARTADEPVADMPPAQVAGPGVPDHVGMTLSQPPGEAASIPPA